MCHYNVDLEELPDDMLLVFMKEFDIDTILSLIGASPVAYRLFDKKRVYICNVHLGHKYIKYEVPAPLVEALHLVHGLQVRDSNHWYHEALFPWPTDKEGSRISLVEKQKKIEDFPGWKNIVAACYVKDDDTNSKEKPEDSSEEHVRHQKRHTRDAINQLLSTKTLTWMKIGIKIVDDMEFVTEKLGLSLGPIPRNPEQTPWNVYREPGLTPISHLQIWLHEFRCHMRDCVRKDLFSSFVLKAGLKSDLHKELVSIPYGALEQEGAPVKRRLMACHKPPAEGSREDKVLAIAMAHPHDKVVYDKTLWESGFEILARLCRLTPSELEMFHLVEFNKYRFDPLSPSISRGMGG